MENHSKIKAFQICRTCMNEVLDSTAVFFHLDFIQSNTEPTIRQKLTDCIPELDLQITPNAIICNKCAESINSVYKFKTECLQSELQIQKYIQQVQHTSDVIDLIEVAQFHPLCMKFKTEVQEITEDFEIKDFKNDPTSLVCDAYGVNEENKYTEIIKQEYVCNYSVSTGEENLVLGNQNNYNVQNLHNNDVYYQCSSYGHKIESLHLKTHLHQKEIVHCYRCILCNFLTKHKHLFAFHNRSHLTKNDYKKIFKCRSIQRNSLNTKTFNKQTYKDTSYRKNRSNSKCSSKTLCTSSKNLEFKQLTSLKSTEIEKLFKCPLCNQSCSCKGNLKRHMQVHTRNRPFRCSICECICATKDYLKIHLQIHTEEKPFKCSLCEYSFKQKGHLNRHMRIHTGEKPFKCLLCEYTCSVNDSLKKHMLIHTGEKPFKCSVCDYQFTEKGSLKKHILIHTGEKPFKCSFCEYSCRSGSTLKGHTRTHTRERPFKCSLCEYSFIHRSNLNRHMRIHTVELFKCSVCEYQSTSQNILNIHMEIHTEEKPFKCSLCDYRCAIKGNLTIHMRIHIGEKRFKCSLCEYKSAKKCNFEQHMLIHTGNKPYKCSLCDYSSIQKGHLKRHIKIHK